MQQGNKVKPTDIQLDVIYPKGVKPLYSINVFVFHEKRVSMCVYNVSNADFSTLTLECSRFSLVETTS